MALTIEVVGMKGYRGIVNGEAIDSGTLYSRVKLDQRYNKPGENFKGGYAVEEWKVPSAEHVFRMQHLSYPFMCSLEVERVSNGKETKEMVIDVRPLENSKTAVETVRKVT
jgi:hypothetical protein